MGMFFVGYAKEVWAWSKRYPYSSRCHLFWSSCAFLATLAPFWLAVSVLLPFLIWRG